MSRSKVNLYIAEAQDQEERINKALELLELSGIQSSVGEIANKVVSDRGTFYDFLDKLLDTALSWKEGNKRERWIRQARFPFIRSLDGFDFTYQPSIDKNLIRELASCRFIKQGKNVLFFGQTGVGKTHLAVALGIEAISKGYDVRCVTIDFLLDLAYKYSNDPDRSKRLFDSLMRPKLLIFDEMDYSETRQTKLISELLYRVIYQRYEKGLSMIFTSNQTFREWAKLFSNQARASAAIDRAAHKAMVITIEGDSWRMRNRLKHSS